MKDRIAKKLNKRIVNKYIFEKLSKAFTVTEITCSSAYYGNNKQESYSNFYFKIVELPEWIFGIQMMVKDNKIVSEQTYLLGEIDIIIDKFKVGRVSLCKTYCDLSYFIYYIQIAISNNGFLNNKQKEEYEFYRDEKITILKQNREFYHLFTHLVKKYNKKWEGVAKAYWYQEFKDDVTWQLAIEADEKDYYKALVGAQEIIDYSHKIFYNDEEPISWQVLHYDTFYVRKELEELSNKERIFYFDKYEDLSLDG